MPLSSSLDLAAALPVLHLSGEVDLATLPQFHDALVHVVDRQPGQRVAVDLDGVDSIDDAGLGLLLGAAGRARDRGGDLVLVCSGTRLRQRLRTTRLDLAVTVFPSVTAAATAG
jgi:anti-sigma B factor antagonist